MTSDGLILDIEVVTVNVPSPNCHVWSSRIHSRYTRTVKDLPTSGLQVHLSLHVRRFFCDTPYLTPTHVGIDDWAFRRNVSYGTILVDLHDHHVVDLLPDRKASTVESWLRAHSGVQLSSRDRAGEYTMGARKGAPDAVQVADRFHIHKNLAEAVERIFLRH